MEARNHLDSSSSGSYTLFWHLWTLGCGSVIALGSVLGTQWTGLDDTFCHPTGQELEAEGSKVQGQILLQSEFEDSLGKGRPYLEGVGRYQITFINYLNIGSMALP